MNMTKSEKTLFPLPSLLLLVVLINACGDRPSQAMVAEMFAKQNPRAKVLHVQIESEALSTEYTITFDRSGQRYTQVWVYLVKGERGQWTYFPAKQW